MNFGFTEEQEMIRKSARDFVRGQSSMERIRAMAEDERGFSPQLYKQMADSGWIGTVFPEEYGGMGLAYVDLLCILEELGKGLMPEPLVNSILAGSTIIFACDENLKKEHIPQIISGEKLYALAAYELSGRFDPAHVETTAKAAAGGGYMINGSKSFVPDAGASDKLLVSARTSGNVGDQNGITLFLLDRNTPGLKLNPVKTMDMRRRFMIELKDVKADAGQVVGQVGQGYKALDQAIDRATLALCAESLGGMETALNMSVAYSKERVQFGKPIGSFQAMKHKAANMFVALETARSATYYATMAVDENQPDMKAAISCAKTLTSDAYVQVTKDAIQIHGGIGFTHEHDIHFFYKRALVSNITFGDPTWHRDRYATEKGF